MYAHIRLCALLCVIDVVILCEISVALTAVGGLLCMLIFCVLPRADVGMESIVIPD